jgi:hypothetical protein
MAVFRYGDSSATIMKKLHKQSITLSWSRNISESKYKIFLCLFIGEPICPKRHPRAVSAALLLSNDSIDDPIILAVVSSFVPGTLFAMLLLVAATPWFINKHPAAADPDRNALFVWLLLAIALAASAMRGPT